MLELCTTHQNELLLFLLVLTRVSGIAVAAPLFGIRQAPRGIRPLLAIGLAVVVTPVFWQSATALPPTDLELAMAFFREAVLGLVLGLALLVTAIALQGAGQIVGQMSGMSLAATADPDLGGNAPLFGRLFDLVATGAFLLTGGHRMVIAGLLDTFAWMPPGQVGFSSGLIVTLQEVVAASFELALRVSAPVVLALLISTLALGFLERVVPQLNVLTLGFGINATLAVAVSAICLGSAVWIFREHTEGALAMVTEAIRSAGQP